MLDGLDEIPWSDLSHAYGEADDVPGLLRGLASPEVDVRKDALYTLYGNIWHQGTVYEATAYAVPFLIELLTVPEVQDQAEILALLQALCHGSSYLDVHQHLDSYRNERETEAFEAERDHELHWVHSAHNSVVEGTPVYVRLLSHPDVAVRTTAPYLLASCVERREEIAPLLTAYVEREEEPAAKASLLFALAYLERRSGGQEVLGLLSSVYAIRAEAPIVRFMAALGATLLGGEPLLAETLPVLHETAAACSDDYAELPWDLGETPVSAVSAVLVLHPRVRLHWLLEMLEHSDRDVRCAAVEDVSEMCRERRFAPSEVVVPLARLVADPDSAVRQDAAKALPTLGSARLCAVPMLTELSRHPSVYIRTLAEQTLAKVQEVRDAYDLRKWLKAPKEECSVSECIKVLESPASAPAYQDAATSLEIVIF
jgi:HEAT repeat protein